MVCCSGVVVVLVFVTEEDCRTRPFRVFLVGTVVVLAVDVQSDAGGLQGAQEDISDELGHGGRCQVDGSLVVPGLLVTKVLCELNLEEFDTSELEPT